MDPVNENTQPVLNTSNVRLVPNAAVSIQSAATPAGPSDQDLNRLLTGAEFLPFVPQQVAMAANAATISGELPIPPKELPGQVPPILGIASGGSRSTWTNDLALLQQRREIVHRPARTSGIRPATYLGDTRIGGAVPETLANRLLGDLLPGVLVPPGTAAFDETGRGLKGRLDFGVNAYRYYEPGGNVFEATASSHQLPLAGLVRQQLAFPNLLIPAEDKRPGKPGDKWFPDRGLTRPHGPWWDLFRSLSSLMGIVDPCDQFLLALKLFKFAVASRLAAAMTGVGAAEAEQAELQVGWIVVYLAQICLFSGTIWTALTAEVHELLRRFKEFIDGPGFSNEGLRAWADFLDDALKGKPLKGLGPAWA